MMKNDPAIPSFTIHQKLQYTLRLAVAMCFIGHGAFGIITKPIWCNYFAVFGIGHDPAYRLMPLLGSFDMLMGIIMLIYPIRLIPLWLVIWGIVTACLRPLSGEPFAEFIERAGNFGAPLALLILSGGVLKNIGNIFTPIDENVDVDFKILARFLICLRIIIFLLFVGHGWLNIIGKKALLSQYSALGFSNVDYVAYAIGICEITAALIVLIRPYRPLILILLIWKITSEFFYPHHEIFEWIERGGSYGVLLALWFALNSKVSYNIKTKLSLSVS
jgi:uncharacterized membrane protein YphA (DoxX/SURF4 family)